MMILLKMVVFMERKILCHVNQSCLTTVYACIHLKNWARQQKCACASNKMIPLEQCLRCEDVSNDLSLVSGNWFNFNDVCLVFVLWWTEILWHFYKIWNNIFNKALYLFNGFEDRFEREWSCIIIWYSCLKQAFAIL